MFSLDDTGEMYNDFSKCFLDVLSERDFDFMVLIIFLCNHSRIKRGDAEVVPLSDAPQWGSLVKETTLLSFLISLFTIQRNLLKERQKRPGSRASVSHITDTCLA